MVQLVDEHPGSEASSNGGALLIFANRPNFKVDRLDLDDIPE
jgi:hypothetical protein